jgi:ATP-dependent RNA helicase MSS116
MVRSSLLLRQLISRSRQSNNNAARNLVQSRGLCLSLDTVRSPFGESLNARSILASHRTFSSRSFSHIGGSIPSRLFSTAGESGDAVEDEVGAAEDALPNFADLKGLHPQTAHTLKMKGFETMTEIQARTWDVAVSGKDVIGRARTGTGKTMAFLLPSLERILQNPVEGKLSIMIISPTRELASQIAKEAHMLTQGHKNVTNQVVYGGIPKRQDMSKMSQSMPTILTATPGRLHDHLKTTQIRGKPFRDSAKDVQVLILDEMDRLLDMGFRDEIEQIVRYMPENRQTLLFSATIPHGVHSAIKKFTKSDSVTVDCMDDEDPASHTNARINQSHVLLPPDRAISGVVQLILRLMEESDHKVLVFFPTTSQVAYYSALFNRGLGRKVLEIHAKKTQGNRSSTSDRFRQAKKGVMFTSDVSARGVDYPDVTHVVQVGMATDRETYIHRLGRTGRAGKKGQGFLVLSETEKPFLKMDLADLDIPRDDFLQGLMNEPLPKHVDDQLSPILHDTRTGKNPDLAKAAESVYRSLFGFYNGRLAAIGIRSKDPLVEMANTFAGLAGLQALPQLTEKLVAQFGLRGHKGISVNSRWGGGDEFNVGRGGGGRGGGRGRDSGGRGGRGGGSRGGRDNESRGGGGGDRNWRQMDNSNFGRRGGDDDGWSNGNDRSSYDIPRRGSGGGNGFFNK